MKDEKLITFVYETLTQWCICLCSRELQNLVKWTCTLKLKNVPLETIEVFKNFMTLHFSSFTSIPSRTASSKLNVIKSLFVLIITFSYFSWQFCWNSMSINLGLLFLLGEMHKRGTETSFLVIYKLKSQGQWWRVKVKVSNSSRTHQGHILFKEYIYCFRLLQTGKKDNIKWLDPSCWKLMHDFLFTLFIVIYSYFSENC